MNFDQFNDDEENYYCSGEESDRGNIVNNEEVRLNSISEDAQEDTISPYPKDR